VKERGDSGQRRVMDSGELVRRWCMFCRLEFPSPLSLPTGRLIYCTFDWGSLGRTSGGWIVPKEIQ